MALTNVWLAGYGGPAVGATAVWIAPNDGTVPSATQVTLVGWNGPVSGATPIWIAGYGGPPPAAIGAIPICIKGWSGSGGSGGGGGATSVWSASDATAGGMTLSNGGLTATGSGALAYHTVRTSISKTAGKLYIEFLATGAATNGIFWGLANTGYAIADNLGDNPISAGIQPNGSGAYSGMGGSGFNYFVPTTTTNANDVWALAVDFATGNTWIAHNNVWANSSNPATGSLPIFTFAPATAGALFAAISLFGPTTQSGVWTLQPTTASQKYAPPAGFSPWG